MNSLYLHKEGCGIVFRHEDVERNTNSKTERIRELTDKNLLVPGFFILWRRKMKMRGVELVGVGRKHESPEVGYRETKGKKSDPRIRKGC